MAVPDPSESQKASPSRPTVFPNPEFTGEMFLARATLRLNGFPLADRMSIEELQHAWGTYTTDRDAKNAEQRAKAEALRLQAAQRELELAKMRRDLEIRTMREKLQGAGISVEGLNDEQIQATYEAEADRRRRLVRAKMLFEGSGIPKLHTLHLANAEATDNRRWLQIRNSIAERIKKGFLGALLGPSGTGKTQIAASVIRMACDQGISCKYERAKSLCYAVTGTFSQVARGQAGEREADVIERYAKVGLLVIDEFHQQQGTEFQLDLLTHIIDIRYGDMRPTILIANQTREAFSASVGSSVVSRIIHKGEAYWCDWPTYRHPNLIAPPTENGQLATR